MDITADQEIFTLRKVEADLETASRDLDRLSIALLGWPRNIVVTQFLPAGTWAELPFGWQTMTQLPLMLRMGVPPWKGQNAVGVSRETALRMIQLLEQGYRG
jgi:hypothetical protein